MAGETREAKDAAAESRTLIDNGTFSPELSGRAASSAVAVLVESWRDLHVGNPQQIADVGDVIIELQNYVAALSA